MRIKQQTIPEVPRTVLPTVRANITVTHPQRLDDQPAFSSFDLLAHLVIPWVVLSVHPMIPSSGIPFLDHHLLISPSV